MTPLFLQYDPFLCVYSWRNPKEDKHPVDISLGTWNGRSFTFCFTSSYYFNRFTNCFCILKNQILEKKNDCSIDCFSLNGENHCKSRGRLGRAAVQASSVGGRDVLCGMGCPTHCESHTARRMCGRARTWDNLWFFAQQPAPKPGIAKAPGQCVLPLTAHPPPAPQYRLRGHGLVERTWGWKPGDRVLFPQVCPFPGGQGLSEVTVLAVE